MRVSVDALSIEATLSGRSGMHVVWIHGYPLSSAIFDHQLQIAGLQHIAPDLPGFGRTAAPTHAMTIDDYGELVLRLCDHLGASKAIFAGVSMGGYIALSIARHHPDRVAGLVLIDSRESADSDEMRVKRSEQAERIEREGVGFVVEDMLPKMFGASTREHRSATVEELRHLMLQTTPTGAITAVRAMAQRPDSADVLRGLNAPMLIVVGSEDPITPIGDAERMHHLAPHSTMHILEGAGHLSQLEMFEEFNAVFANWSRSLPR